MSGFPDSLFVANGHYWTDYDVDPITDEEIPVSLREKARREGKDEAFYIRISGLEETHDFTNYWDSPREMKFSVRVKW